MTSHNRCTKLRNISNQKEVIEISLDANMEADIAEKHGERSKCVHLGAVTRIQDKTRL
jgi:hypothetical protein